MSDFAAFGNLERGSWSDPARASGYVELFASASDQAIESLLDAAGVKPNMKVLDLCCGQGNVSEALIRRECKITGIDFSPAMLASGHQVRSLSKETHRNCLLTIHNLMSSFQIWAFAMCLINRVRYPKCDEYFDQMAALR